MTTYTEALQSRRQRLAEVSEAICAALPAWSIVPRDDDAFNNVLIRHQGGAVVYLSIVTYGTNAGKLHASMGVPYFDLYKGDAREQVDTSDKEHEVYVHADAYKFPHVDVDRFRIGVNISAGRPVPTIANDLNRRLLQHAIAFHAEAMEKIAEHRARLDNRAATIDSIVAAVEGARKWGTDGVSFGDYNHAEVLTDGRVHFTSMSCDPEQAIEIMQILNRNKGRAS
jgi:hypothetical protein